MPVRGLVDSIRATPGAILTGSLTPLRSVVIGVDAGHWFRSRVVQHRDPFRAAVAGVCNAIKRF